jgi:hypothetical protein
VTGRGAPRDVAVFGAVAAVGLLAALVFAGVGVHELSYASDHPHAYGPAKVIAWGAGAGALLAFAVAGLAWSLLRSTR